eukprot:9084146-Prorocentrum_lima.AAC.1
MVRPLRPREARHDDRLAEVAEVVHGSLQCRWRRLPGNLESSAKRLQWDEREALEALSLVRGMGEGDLR